MLCEWKEIQRQNFTHWEKLADFLELDQDQRLAVHKKPKFPLNLPMRLAQKVVKKTLHDPILSQFLPLQEETVITPHFTSDPVCDTRFMLGGKLIKKYAGRLLLLTTSSCVMHCRFCFRQHFPYERKKTAFIEELAQISADQTIHEVILSGGDPLSLSNQDLSDLFEKLDVIPHLRRIRFHTRFPIGIPERLDSGLQQLLANSSKQIWFVLHTNHPHELDEDIFAALKRLQKVGAALLSQTVLLKGINDNVETIFALCESLVNHGVMPYQIHQLDRVQGGAHFEVPEKEGLRLIHQLTKMISGYAVPRYVKEVAGSASKLPVV